MSFVIGVPSGINNQQSPAKQKGLMCVWNKHIAVFCKEFTCSDDKVPGLDMLAYSYPWDMILGSGALLLYGILSLGKPSTSKGGISGEN